VLSEYAKAFHWIAYVTVFANRSTKGKAEDIMFIYFNSVPISMALAPVEGRTPHINHPIYRPA